MSSSSQPSPSTIFYQHSPEPHQHQHQNQVKYPENGHDTLSDFVTFVCQETDSNNQNAQVSQILLPNTSFVGNMYACTEILLCFDIFRAKANRFIQGLPIYKAINISGVIQLVN